MSIGPDSFRDRFLSRLCQYDFLLYLVFVFEIMLLLFGGLSFLFADLPPETRSILVLDFALLGVLLPVTIGLIYVCRAYDSSRRRFPGQ